MYWWQEKPIYQIYPKSFKSGNNKEVGDLRGIIEKLDYIKSLDVSAIWISPIFKSPMKDNGYDISDYREIDPSFGTKEELKELIDKAHQRGLKIILDMVLNHTSDQHEWFKKSLNNDPKYRDWYIWRKQKDDERIKSWFEESAWKKVGDEYYLHFFSTEQPDLNWENPEVQQEMVDIGKYWIDFGADGFRLDVITLIGKDIDNGEYLPGPFLRKNLNLLKNSWGDKNLVTIGEGPGVTVELSNEITDLKEGPLSMHFAFDVHEGEFSDYGSINGTRTKFVVNDFDLVKFKKGIHKWQSGIKDGWQGLFFGNHDFSRTVSKWGDDSPKHWRESTKAINALLFALRGTPFIYQGDEIGMINSHIDDFSQFDDTEIKTRYKEFVLDKKALTHDQFMAGANKMGRDNARTPMQWTKDGGFSASSKTWLPMNMKRLEEINVEAQENDPQSVLNFYRTMSKFRNEYKDFIEKAAFDIKNIDNSKVFHLVRTLGDKTMEVIINWSSEEVEYEPTNNILITNLEAKNTSSLMKPWELRIKI